MGIRVLKNKHTFQGKANAAQSPTRGRMKMDIAQLFGVNLPVAVVNVLANVFFIFCLARPSQGEPLKQPLKLLLWTVICSTLSFLVSLLVLFHWVTDSIVAHFSSYGMFVLSLSVSMSTSVWLNFFYHMQIVPLKNTIFVWIKKNLKPIIYCIWVVDNLIIGLTVSSILTIIIFRINNLNDLQLAEQLNYNYSNSINSYVLLPSHLVNLRFSVIAIQIYFIICLCIMSASSLSTAIYLSRHMRQMASQGLSCSRFRSQVRVTATGILQGALHALVSLWTLTQYRFCEIVAGSDTYMTLPSITIICFYMMGTSVNLGVGQTVFRQRVVDLWHRAVRYYKTIRPQQK